MDKILANEPVWISKAMLDQSLQMDISTPMDDVSIWESKLSLRFEKHKSIIRNLGGEVLSADEFPKKAWFVENPVGKGAVPDIFCSVNGYWFVSKELAGVLAGFDMGNGACYPIQPMKFDTDTAYRVKLFCLNFGNRKATFLPEHSNRESFKEWESNKPSRIGDWENGEWELLGSVRDDDIAVSKAALAGPDLWVDPRINCTFFVSGRLGKVLHELGMHRVFGLKKCRVLDL